MNETEWVITYPSWDEHVTLVQVLAWSQWPIAYCMVEPKYTPESAAVSFENSVVIIVCQPYRTDALAAGFDTGDIKRLRNVLRITTPDRQNASSYSEIVSMWQQHFN